MYEVEKIVASRLNKKGKKQYNVKWSGYDSSQNTWQPLSNLTSVQDLIDRFERKEGKESSISSKKKTLRSTPKPNMNEGSDDQEIVDYVSGQSPQNDQNDQDSKFNDQQDQQADKSQNNAKNQNKSFFDRRFKRGRPPIQKSSRKQIKILGMTQIQKQNFVYRVEIDGRTQWVKRNFLIPQYMLELILYYESGLLFKNE